MYNQGRGSGPCHWQQGGHTYLYNGPHLSVQQPGQAASTRPRAFDPPSIPILITNPYAPNQFGEATATGGTPLSHASTQAAAVSFNRALPCGTNVFSATTSTGGNNIPCSRPGCFHKFHSKKNLELHLMDRHFIYPPGYNPRKRKRDEGRGPDGDAARCVNRIVAQ